MVARAQVLPSDTVIGERNPATPREPLYLTCPRCGLSMKPRQRWLAIQHCPRCLARSRIPVRLFSSPLPAHELYAEGSAPAQLHAQPHTKGVSTT